MDSFLRKPLKNNKKGMSTVVGYVLLITFGLVLSVIVFNYLKTYVPKDTGSCPDGVSIFIESAQCSNGTLNLTLKNNGRFDYPAYSIHATNNPNQTVATVDLANNLIGSSDSYAQSSNDLITFNLKNSAALSPGSVVSHLFKYTTNLYSIEIVPVIFQKVGSTMQYVRCSDDAATQEINCSV